MAHYVYGWHAVGQTLKENPDRVTALFLLRDRKDKRAAEVERQARTLSIEVKRLDRFELDQLAQGQLQGVVIELKSEPKAGARLSELLETIAHPPMILILDQVQDPHNLGACMRSAAVAGADAVIIPKHRAVGLTAAVRKIASGAAERVPVFTVANLARAIEDLQAWGLWVYGFAEEASTSLYELDLSQGVALVMGSEDKGLRHLTRQRCDKIAAIPASSYLSSLNVSVASGIVLFEAVRQRSLTQS